MLGKLALLVIQKYSRRYASLNIFLKYLVEMPLAAVAHILSFEQAMLGTVLYLPVHLDYRTERYGTSTVRTEPVCRRRRYAASLLPSSKTCRIAEC